MIVKEMIINELRRLGADGLCCPDYECGCSIDDLVACMGDDIALCEAAKAIKLEDMSQTDRDYCESEGIDVLYYPLNAEYKKEAGK